MRAVRRITAVGWMRAPKRVMRKRRHPYHVVNE
jgi:hypothetical protein